MTTRMLVIAPHPDDEVLGAGGSIARVAEAGGQVHVLTVAAHMPPLYDESVHRITVDEARRAHAKLGVASSEFLDRPAVLLRDQPLHEVNQLIKDAVEAHTPDVVLIPFKDLHIDHQLVFDASLVATRPVGAGQCIKLLAAYETLSETHWLVPGVEATFVPH